MKIFNSMQELWDYCSLCPICQLNKRDITISVGPDSVFTLTGFKKKDNSLKLECAFKKKQNVYTVEYDINCETNHFKIDVTDVKVIIEETKLPIHRVTEAYFYFYIQSRCPECECSSAHGADLELDIVDKKISNIELERESFWLLKESDKFHITVIHDRNVMLVSRCHGLDDFDYREDEKTIELPLVKLDLSNQPKMVNKIKTLILFS